MISPTAAPDVASPPGSFRHRFWALFLLGLLGIATLPFALVPLLRATPLPPEVPELPLAVVVVLSMIQPTLLLAGGTALGVSLAPRVGLVSHVATWAERGTPIWPHLRSEAPLALTAGLVLGLVTVPLDLLFEPYLGPAWAEAMKETAEFEGPGALISGLLYGGITEEVMLRWGLLSFLVWAGWRLLQRRRGTPGPGVMWGAIVLAALAFGLGHLPAVAAFAPLSPVLIMRTVVLNALGGVLFGWLFWRRSLEAAMLGHAAANLGSTVIFWSGLLTP